jgi:hydrogenase maturation protein HypF
VGGAAERRRVLVGGLVQGVGFRPFVHREASRLGLAGWVANTGQGVTIEAEGRPDRLAALVETLRRAPPPGAVVADVAVSPLAPLGERGFAIRQSALAGGRTARVPLDLAPCEACLAELADPADRRWRYPFINCVACGPRFSLIEAMPYDRARTSMRRFAMCAQCQAEYDDPASRRFHAEINACPACGPRLTLLDAGGGAVAAEDAALVAAAEAIRGGSVVAVKGVGGFHLFVDARSEAAVGRLRARKAREAKPFAVVFAGLAEVRAACRPTSEETALLTSRERPIVLVRRAGGDLAEAVAPANPWIGALLPYAPLHQLLMGELGFPVVATSGNLAGEPIAIDDATALQRLAGVADVFLTHDREIVRPVEDSVARVVCGRSLLLRRSRGYAPAPIAVPGLPAGVIARGGHLKATVAASGPDGVVLWPHIGDLDSVEGRRAHRRAVADLTRLYAIEPRAAAQDEHPDYGSRSAESGPPAIGVQHHLAHVMACLADNGAPPPALGVAWDGVGLGTDGTLWGGEFLQVTDEAWRRVARLRPFRLPGGEAAIREPRRAAVGLLFAAFGPAALAMDDLAPVAAFAPAERRTLAAVLERGANAPWCSSVGRLFDVVAALAGLHQTASYEGEAASALEWAAGEHPAEHPYAFALAPDSETGGLMLDWRPALDALLADLHRGASVAEIAAALHEGLAAAIVAVAQQIGEPRVALTGGCFQNARLTEAAVAALRAAGFEPLWHRQVPPNDGGLALGQAVWAARQLAEEEATPCA